MKWLIVLALVLTSAGAKAGLTDVELRSIAASTPADARLDPALTAPDENGHFRSLGSVLGGRPAFLVFIDYTCNTLCGTELLFLGAAIERAKLPGGAPRIIAFGINPKDGPAAARAMEEQEIPHELRHEAVFLSPNPATIARATRALGFRYLYDAAIGQFAHPAVIYAIAVDGRVRETLSPFALMTSDLAAALYGRQPESFAERIRAICYGLGPLRGVYDRGVMQILAAAGAITLGSVGGVLGLLLLRGKPS